jgi:subtilisin-like proprotein convertase family protein
MRSFLFLALLFQSSFLFAQTFTGSGGHIPDDGNSVDFEINVGGLPTSMDTLNFGIESVCLNITHAWVADLAIVLVAPDGTTLSLLSGIGADTDGFVNTCLSGNSSTSIFQVWYPFTGTFKPFGDMGKLNVNGINPNGVWKLHILDTYAFADEGDLIDWNITFGNQPCKPFPFASSDLPIVKISTNGNNIVNDPKVDAHFQLIANSDGSRNQVNQTNYAYEGPIGIELRGVSSQGFPKKSYGFEMRDTLGEDLDVTLLGMPETSDYALLANFSDKTLMRNALAYETSRQLGQYATRSRFCEVILDDTYQGVYLLTEKIKRGNERVDVSKLDYADTVGVAMTGGYLLQIDWNTTPGWFSQFSQPNSPNIFTYFQHVYPKWDAIHPKQQAYIQSYVDSFEVALHGPEYQDTVVGWRKYADEKAFIDYLIVNELSKNVDGYRLSTQMHKKRDDKGGKLRMGPVWDYDLAWYNADYCDNFLPSGWAYDINYICGDAGVPFWWERLASDTLFAQNLACRWQLLRNEGPLNKTHFFGIIDSMAAVVEEAQGRNFKYWDILGQYVWPNPGPLPTTYEGEIQKLKNWLSQRLQWLDGAILDELPALDANFLAQSQSAFSYQFSAPAGYQYLWNFGDGSSSIDADPLHEFPGFGTYSVQLTVSTPFGCQVSSSQTIQIINSASNEAPFTQFQVAPNPARDFIRIKLTRQSTEPIQVRLNNTLGQTVLNASMLPLEREILLDIKALPRGVYSLELSGAKSVRVVVE